ncbi:MAG: cardiolipin synthase A, partial [Planctomycetes bacterium]|nr:cardiolipin synthase A [Planctomycetota bacterium]
VEGAAARCLEEVFLQDWEIETGTGAEPSPLGPPPDPATAIQFVPSGPQEYDETVHQVLLAAIYSASDEICLTSPYFVPDESTLNALRSAALRGVRVTIVLPAKCDSVLVRFASAATFARLLDVGVRIIRYERGLLHTKSVTIDRRFSLLGSVNLDMRSIWLNSEITALVYDESFGRELRDLQESYIASGRPVESGEWSRRGRRQRIGEAIARLASPVL